MSHIAIAEKADGSAVTWLEQVTDAQYGAVTPSINNKGEKP
jgi:hypothetical protein